MLDSLKGLFLNKSGGFRANGGFSQSSLSERGNPNAEAFGRRGCLSPSWRESADGRVPQPPSSRETFGVPAEGGENRLEREKRQIHLSRQKI